MYSETKEPEFVLSRSACARSYARSTACFWRVSSDSRNPN
jgi:hypothetical protein